VNQLEYVVQVQHLAASGYIVLEYEARGWYGSGGQIGTAGPNDQKDTSEVISYVLNQAAWQPDPDNVALVGISYGAGLALLGAGRDDRVKTAVAMSGWMDLERALFENSCPNLVWGDILMLSGHMFGRPTKQLSDMFRAVMRGNESAFHDFAALRSANRYVASLEARQVPLFLSNNFEDRLFQPQDSLDFFGAYSAPKRLMLNQGIHASAEIGGLVGLPYNHVWVEVKKWLDAWLKGKSGPTPPLVEMQLRNNKAVREQFDEWPSSRVAAAEYDFAPRGNGFHGKMLHRRPGQARVELADPTEFETISFSKRTGINAGLPVVGEVLEVYIDKSIKSSLLFSSRQHSIWYYANTQSRTRFCGSPWLSLDLTATHRMWQVVAYVFRVNQLTKVGTLMTHGALTCWNCTAGERQTRQIQLRALCDEVGGFAQGGLALALNLYSDLYKPANTDRDLKVAFHYSANFTLTLPALEDSDQLALPVLV